MDKKGGWGIKGKQERRGKRAVKVESITKGEAYCRIKML